MAQAAARISGQSIGPLRDQHVGDVTVEGSVGGGAGVGHVGAPRPFSVRGYQYRVPRRVVNQANAGQDFALSDACYSPPREGGLRYKTLKLITKLQGMRLSKLLAMREEAVAELALGEDAPETRKKGGGIMKHLAPAAIVLLASCSSPPTIDMTDDSSLKSSVAAVRATLSPERRGEFDKALERVLDYESPAGNPDSKAAVVLDAALKHELLHRKDAAGVLRAGEIAELLSLDDHLREYERIAEQLSQAKLKDVRLTGTEGADDWMLLGSIDYPLSVEKFRGVITLDRTAPLEAQPDFYAEVGTYNEFQGVVFPGKSASDLASGPIPADTIRVLAVDLLAGIRIELPARLTPDEAARYEELKGAYGDILASWRNGKDE